MFDSRGQRSRRNPYPYQCQKEQVHRVIIWTIFCLVSCSSLVKTDQDKDKGMEDHSQVSKPADFIPFPPQIIIPQKTFLLSDNSSLTIGSTEIADLKLRFRAGQKPCYQADNFTVYPSPAILREQSQNKISPDHPHRVIYKGTPTLFINGTPYAGEGSCNICYIMTGGISFPVFKPSCKTPRESITVEWTSEGADSGSMTQTVAPPTEKVKEMTDCYLLKYLEPSLAQALQEYINPQLLNDWMSN